jgi:hypothetical protein
VDCPDDEVCNSNHICGPLCEPETCASAYAGLCGQQLDDSCGGTIDCNCSGGLACSATTPGTTGICKALNNCADYTDGTEGALCSNGASPDFPRGDGYNLTCRCDGSMDFIDSGGNLVNGAQTGTCCQNTNSCDGVHCTTTNSCTGEVDYCCNNATQWCDNGTNTCVDRLQCSEIYYDNPGSPPPNDGYADGTLNAPCSNGGNRLFDDGSGTLIACPCQGGLFCVDGDGATPGWCCENTNTCTNTPLDENCMVPSSCAGEDPEPCCDWNECCTAGRTCEDARTCDYYTDGTEGSACSRNNHFETCPAGSTTSNQIRCNCNSGLCCAQPDRDLDGTCVPNPQGDGTCQVWDPCRERNIDCCGANQYCDTGRDVCVDLLTCDDFNIGGVPDGDLGDPCSSVPNENYPAGDGSYLACPCDWQPGWPNIACEGDSGTTIGTCSCTPNICTCANHSQGDGCGGIQDCPCPPALPVCDTSVNPPECCAPYECPTGAGGECGVVHNSCGQNITCGCPDEYETCGGGGVDHVCGCTPDTCRGRTGTFPDSCGGEIICSG